MHSFRVAFLVLFGLTALQVHGYCYPVSGFNAKHLLTSADVVCHGLVETVEDAEIDLDSAFGAPRKVNGGKAQVRVLNAIKGTPPTRIQVDFPRSTAQMIYTQLSPSQEVVLFLRQRGHTYTFVDVYNGVLPVSKHRPLAYRAASDDGRMVEELLVGTRTDTSNVRLRCIEQLRYFSTDASIERLKELSREDDLVVRGVAYEALLWLDTPPDAAALVAFFADHAGTETESVNRFRTTGYSDGHLKGRILLAIDGRLGFIDGCFGLDGGMPIAAQDHQDRQRAARAAAPKWQAFDLIGFLQNAAWKDRDTSSVRGNDIIATILFRQIDPRGIPATRSKTYRKGTLSIAADLLNHADRIVRAEAALLIDFMIDEPHVFPGKSDVLERRGGIAVSEYVAACKEWLAAHPAWVAAHGGIGK